MYIFMILLFIIGLPAILLAAHSIYRSMAHRRHAIAAPGIDEAGLVFINGIEQYVQIRGKNPANPILLLLHGGPGSPLSAMNHSFQYAWQVTQYVQKRFGVTKIALMGHSWGTVLGTALAQTYPEAFSCYIGVGQVTNLQTNEKVGYEETVKRAQNAGNSKDIAALTALSAYPGNVFSDEFCKQMLTVRKYQQKYKIAETISLKNVMLVVTSPYYSFLESMYYTKNTVMLHKTLFRYLFEEYDALALGTEYQIPVYYIMGEQDYQTPVPLAKALFDLITAPHKKLFLIPDAGHFTMQDNAPGFNRALLGEIRTGL